MVAGNKKSEARPHDLAGLKAEVLRRGFSPQTHDRELRLVKALAERENLCDELIKGIESFSVLLRWDRISPTQYSVHCQHPYPASIEFILEQARYLIEKAKIDPFDDASPSENSAIKR